jgi:hypothetical protein
MKELLRATLRAFSSLSSRSTRTTGASVTRLLAGYYSVFRYRHLAPPMRRPIHYEERFLARGISRHAEAVKLVVEIQIDVFTLRAFQLVDGSLG